MISNSKNSYVHKCDIEQLQAVNIINIPLDISKKILMMKMMTISQPLFLKLLLHYAQLQTGS